MSHFAKAISVCTFPLFVHRRYKADELGMWKSARLGLRFQGWGILPSRDPASKPQSDAPGLDNDWATYPGKQKLTDTNLLLSRTETVTILKRTTPSYVGFPAGVGRGVRLGNETCPVSAHDHSLASQSWNLRFVEFKAKQLVKDDLSQRKAFSLSK